MASKSAKNRGSVNFSRSLKANIKPKEEWRVRLKDQHIFNSIYSCEVLLLVESNYTLCPATSEIEEQGEESTAVKFLTPTNLIKFLVNTYTSRPEYDYFGLYDEAYAELQEEYTLNNKLSPESLVYLIKLRILAYNEIIAQDRALIKELKYSLQQEMGSMNDNTNLKVVKKPERTKSVSTKPNPLDQKYLQAKAGKIPNFVEMRTIPTIYNTDYDEPNPENIYYVLSGIYDASLIILLQKCNVGILSLIELSMEGVKFNQEEMVLDNLDDFEFDRILAMRSFWRNLEQNQTDIPKISRNTCYMKYSIPDTKTETPSFDNFLIVLKNISDFKRLYYHYFATVRYLDVTELSKPICLSSMNSYNGLLDQVPNECISIPLMLHALLDEVCVRVDNWTNEQLIALNNKKKVKRKYHGGPVVQITSLLRDYDCCHKKIAPIINMPKAVKISYGNTLDFKYAHVPINKFINITEITLNELKRTLPLRLFEKIDARNNFDIMFYKYVFSKWSEQLANVSIEELTLCVYAYLFTRGNFRNFNMPKALSHLTKENKLNECMFGITKLYNEMHKVLNIHLNGSFFNTNSSLQGVQIPPITNVKTEVEDDDGINKSCDNLSQEYATLAEELDPGSFIQMINVAYNNYNHFDYKYFSPTDVILLRFHYTNDKCGFSRKNEKYFLRTPLCFRDFCYKLLLEDSEWFLKEEKEYWKQTYINKEKETEYLMQHPKVDDYYDPKEFIIPGSIKAEYSKSRHSTGKRSLPKSAKNEKKKSLDDKSVRKRSVRKSKESIFSMKINGPNTMRTSVSVPSCDPYDKEKIYAYEIYNLGQSFYPLEFEEILYHSLISVKLTKQQLPKQPLSCTFVVSTQNVNLVLHCEYDGIFKAVKPLHFNVNMINGVVMVFSIPTPPIFHVENRHIVMHSRNNDEIRNSYRNDSLRSSITKVTERTSATDEMDPKVSELKNEVLQYLSIAMKEKLPVFKIISSRLHKYQYVKRIKSKITLPFGSIYRRVCCKPILYKRLPKKQNIYEAKCVPYSDLVNKEKSPIDWKWNCSIPTGLSMETVQANVPNDFYIRQRYVIERTDLPSIQNEAYRCYLRCGIIMKFLKDGSIKTLSPDKTLSHYKYGYFSSNKYRAGQSRMKDIRLKRQTNVIPLHAYKKNLTSLEKRVRKISKKYKRHLIDIAENYRFERSRADSRKLHKIYKLSKKIYTKDSHVIPLINYSVITAEGRFIDVKNNIVHDTNKKYEETRCRDYLLNETVTRREDGTCWMIDKDGNAITQFPDGSRIRTWYTILEENLLLGEDPVGYQKRVTVVEERGESLTKYSQTVVDECDTINEEEDVEVLYNKEPIKEQSNSIGFVLVGLNYSFEHPNFATVSYYCWEDSSADVLIPDKINVTVYAEGTYKLKLINNDTINVNTQKVEFLVHNTETMIPDICSINLGTFSEDKPKPERSFLSVKENNQKVFVIACDGNTSTNKKSNSSNTPTFESENSLCSDRMFVMKRDLSGMEMIKEPIPYKFVHTLIDLKDVMSSKDHENVVIGPTKLKIFQPLRKTYSEHLMMIYDIPILATTKERRCLDKLWKLHDLDINTIVPKRSPLVIYERYISCLPGQIIVEQLAQAVLKCIIEGNENLPDIKMIQDLVKTEEMVAEPVIVAEKVSDKKYVPKHLTYKKHLDKYKQLTKVTSIPPYFKTVRGLMFLAVEECSEAAMDESSARRRSQTFKKHAIHASLDKKLTVAEKTQNKKIQAIEKKLDKLEGKREKQKACTKSETFAADRFIHKPIKSQSVSTTASNALQTKLNIPDHVAVHLKPNAHVHEIILTANGLQIITDKNLENLENFYYPSLRNSQLNNTFAGKNDEKRSAVEKREAEPVDGSDADPSCADMNEKYPSFLGEDIGNYFNSTMKIPSWDDSLCQKACLDSFITTTNTLVTTPESKPNEVKSCKQETCVCSVDSIERLAKCCQCKKYYCNCKDTYSAFATCSLQNELNVSEAVCVLATKIIQTIEKDPAKFNLLNTKLPYIIRDTAIAWAMSEPVANDLTKTLKWIMDKKLKKQNTIPEMNAIDIVKHIEATVSKIKISNRTVPLTIGNLQKMADLVLNFVCNSKNNVNITKEIRKLLHDAKISRADIIDTLKLAKEKIHLYYEHGLYPDLPIPEIPPESKCCKIAQYVDYLLDNILEGTCEKCNLRSFLVNTSIHNTSPVNYGSKASFQKSELTNQKISQLEPQTPNNSNIMTNNVEISADINYEHEKEKPNIIVEPLPSPVLDMQTNDDEAFDISSAGGFSLIKSCEEVVDVSVPFITKKNTNLNEDSKPQPVQSREDITDEENKYFLSKIKFGSISEVPDGKDIITIMAPEQNLDSGVINETHSGGLLSPLLLRAQKTSNTKPIVYDGNIISQ